MSNWFYNNEPFDENLAENYVGFVYLISNHTTGMDYIGKKHFQKRKRYQKNKKKRSMLVESDWKEYVGSNELLQEHIERGDDIHKSILWLCETKGWMTYMETFEILARGAIQNDDFYNRWVSCKIQATHLKGDQNGFTRIENLD